MTSVLEMEQVLYLKARSSHKACTLAINCMHFDEANTEHYCLLPILTTNASINDATSNMHLTQYINNYAQSVHYHVQLNCFCNKNR